ncbi:lysine--tRNA ligase [bacterium]|nr:lysine--tRNA ligase [bacterium]
MAEEEIRKQRMEKLEILKNKNIEPYGRKYEKVKIKNIGEKGDVKTAGRIIALRKHGGASFADIVDTEGKIQLYFKKNIIGKEKSEIFKEIDIGDFIGVEGEIFKTKTGEKTILVKNFTVLSKSLKPLPEKWHGLRDIEIRFRKRYLDLLMNKEVREKFIKRTKIIQFIRKYLNDLGFLEVETPMMHPIPGGAEAKPFITYHNTLEMNLYLRIAPELYLKRLLVGNFEKIYEINRSFRNEGISPLHNPEFTMLELYSAYGDYKEMMEITENLLITLVKNLYDKLKITYQGKEIDFSLPWEKITWSDVFKKVGITNWKDITCVKEKINDFQLEIEEEKQNNLFELLDFIFKKKIQPDLINPTFVIDYPVEISPLAKSKKDNSEITERFELFIGGLEVANAYSELNDPIEQYARFYEKAKGDKEKIDFDYIEALEYGMPPAGGLGIGIDRLVMILTDSPSIREVILFPLLRPKK